MNHTPHPQKPATPFHPQCIPYHSKNIRTSYGTNCGLLRDPTMDCDDRALSRIRIEPQFYSVYRYTSSGRVQIYIFVEPIYTLMGRWLRTWLAAAESETCLSYVVEQITQTALSFLFLMVRENAQSDFRCWTHREGGILQCCRLGYGSTS